MTGAVADVARTGVYVVAEVSDVSDAAALVEYWRRVRGLIAEHGGRILASTVHGGRVVEGAARDDSVVTVQWWPTSEAFQDFWQSAAYAPLRELRQAAATTSVRVVLPHRSADA